MDGVLTTDIREREDLSNVVDTLLLNSDDMKFLSFVGRLGKISEVFGQGVEAQKHEWFDDEARAIQISLTATGDGDTWDTVDDITDLPCATAECNKLRIGDLLLLPLGDEVVRVSTITVASQTIGLTSRGWGSSTATVQEHAAFTAKIIGNAQDENSDPIAANYQAPTEKYNYCQIFEDVASVSGTVRRSKAVAGDIHDQTVIRKLKELLRSFNRAISEGIRHKSGNIATMGGIREFLATTSNVGGALSIAKTYTALIAHVDAGLFPHAIHADATTIGTIEQLFNTTVRTKSSEKKGGQSINVITAMGYNVELHVDRDSRTGEFLIVDYNRCAIGPLAGGRYENGNFAAYKLWDKNHGKQTATELLGEMTLRVSNGGATKAYGIT